MRHLAWICAAAVVLGLLAACGETVTAPDSNIRCALIIFSEPPYTQIDSVNTACWIYPVP